MWSVRCPLPMPPSPHRQLMSPYIISYLGGRGILHRATPKYSEASVTEIILHISQFRLLTSLPPLFDHLSFSRTSRRLQDLLGHAGRLANGSFRPFLLRYPSLNRAYLGSDKGITIPMWVFFESPPQRSLLPHHLA